MPGEPDPLYVKARKVLLDALTALESHLDALVLVGAQAVYLHTGAADLAVAEYTIDADLAIGPADLADHPLLADALTSAGLTPGDQPGRWTSPDRVYVDLMVPEALAGPGRRGARLGPHGKSVARRAKGLEGTLVDCARRRLGALDAADRRQFDVSVAGPAALFVAKLHKISERRDDRDRSRDKDALDVLRLLRAVSSLDLANSLRMLIASELAGTVTTEALGLARELFADENAVASRMAAQAAEGAEDPAVIAASVAALTSEVLDEVAAGGRPERV